MQAGGVKPSIPLVTRTACCAPVYSIAMDYLWTPWRYAYIKNSSATESRLGVPDELAAWPGDQHCVFCNLIAAVDYAESGKACRRPRPSAPPISSSAPRSCFVCLNAFPYTSGHMMVVPYAHQPSLGELDRADRAGDDGPGAAGGPGADRRLLHPTA